MAVLIALLLVSFLSPKFSLAFAPPSSVAPDGPGALAYFNLARKDCVGTARNTTSKVWFTLADGVLSDVYYPTLDNTNVKTLEYVVTDGKTFTDLQTRDTTYTVSSLDPRVPGCRVITTARNGKYRITTDYVTDPAHNSVVAHVRFDALIGASADYKFYVRYDPIINGNGGGGAGNGGPDNASTDTTTSHPIALACDTFTKSNATNRTYAQPVCSALAASAPFLEITNGFAGKPSDGLTQLDGKHALTAIYSQAYNGNVVQTAQVDLSQNASFMLALGFGKNAAEAIASAQASLAVPFEQLRTQYRAGWNAYDAALIAPPAHFTNVPDERWNTLVEQYYASVNLIKASEDKTFPGAVVASLASPWGQAISAGDPDNLFFGSYREVFARDAYHAWTGLYSAGDLDTARAVVRFLFEKQQLQDGSFPRNSLLNGQPAPDSNGIQLDQASDPLIMAYQSGMDDPTLYERHIKPAANFLISHGPAFGVDRWEEQSGYSPSTIAAEIAGLICAAEIADKNGDTSSANVWRGVADKWQRSVEKWTVTANGPLAVHPYYIRVSKTGDPNAAFSYDLGNGGPTLEQRSVVDMGFLELARLGVKTPNVPLLVQSLAVVDRTLKREKASGVGWLRYNGDGYGDRANGNPWTPEQGGSGHVWSLLAAERGEYALLSGDTKEAVSLLTAMSNAASGPGLMPEQVWDLPDLPASPYGTAPAQASIGFRNGHAAGSAAPLTWAAGAYVRLFRDLVSHHLLDQPEAVSNRYIVNRQGATTLTITPSLAYTSSNGSLLRITGSSVAGSTIYVATTSLAGKGETTIIGRQANPDGTFSLLVLVKGGGTVLNVVAVSPDGSTALVHRAIRLNVR